MANSFERNPDMRNLPRQLHSQLVQWAEGIPLNKFDRTEPGTMAKDGTFRLDLQGFLTAHSVRWMNLQVQWQNQTLFTVFVQFDAYNRNAITASKVWDTIVLGAHQSVLEQTLFVGYKEALNPNRRKDLPPSVITVVERKRYSPREVENGSVVTDVELLSRIGK